MPKHSRYSSVMRCKVNTNERKDKQKRYRVTLPKRLGDSEIEVIGIFKYDPKTRTIVFDTRPPVKIALANLATY